MTARAPTFVFCFCFWAQAFLLLRSRFLC